uniref:pirin family protein n=1 Tax=Ningiella ruwaisensis TaxID=2364274 RepID=UPI00109F707D|nr:pirin family protein [Ningiella ruwaisensis]
MAKRLAGKQHELGGLVVTRILPHIEKKMVGPFIFFDHMGPTEFEAGQGINVRPHPHIGLSTLTYLFTGSILHRDSLGNHLEIFPGDVNLMTAGKGIVHSERETFEVRANPHSIDGLQCWVALPAHMTELEPSFQHVKKAHLPTLTKEGLMMRLIVGEAYGMSSPVKTYSPMFYLDIAACEGSEVSLPCSNQEAALYVISGEITIGDKTYTNGDFILFESEDAFSFEQAGRVVLLGGDKFEKAPHITWNFVAYDKARIEQAIEDWRSGKFPLVPDDNKEFIPF